MTIYKLKKASNLMLFQWFNFQTLKFAKSKTQWGRVRWYHNKIWSHFVDNTVSHKTCCVEPCHFKWQFLYTNLFFGCWAYCSKREFPYHGLWQKSRIRESKNFLPRKFKYSGALVKESLASWLNLFASRFKISPISSPEQFPTLFRACGSKFQGWEAL